ncbi:hypothetical protein [Maricaulis maris]|uniref:hypothetical protein n=1 Tax=Maricaulis maris TaxID=74318 RepID=UPI0030C73861
MMRHGMLFATLGASLLAGCSTMPRSSRPAADISAHCTDRPGSTLTSVDQARDCIDDFRQVYRGRADANSGQRRAFRSGTLFGSLGAVANALSGGSDGATTGLGLIAGTSATLSPIVAPPAQATIYLDGQRAANCLFRESSGALQRRTLLDGAMVTRFITSANALGAILDTAPTRDGATGPYRTSFESVESAIRDILRVRDAAVRARLDNQLEGDQLMSALIDVDLALQLRLHNLDVSLESSVNVANQSILTLAGQLSQRPDLFSLPDPVTRDAGVQNANDVDIALDNWLRRNRPALARAQADAEAVTALLDSLALDHGGATGIASCIDIASGLTTDIIRLLQPPVAIDLADLETRTQTLDAEGGNAPYTAQWVGATPPGLALSVADSGAGRFTLEADAKAAQPGRYQIILRDEDLRPMVVLIRVTGDPASRVEDPSGLAGGSESADTPAPETVTPAAGDGASGSGADTVFVTANGTEHAVCRVTATVSPPYAGVAAMQAGICQFLGDASAFGQPAGYVFRIDGEAGPASDEAARAALAWREADDAVPGDRTGLYDAVCRVFDLENC